MMRVPKELGVIADVVLAYRPPEKAKATKRREDGFKQKVYELGKLANTAQAARLG